MTTRDTTKPELGSLEHYGVVGMKWGVHNGTVREGASRRERKAAKKESKLAYKAWKKEVGGEKVANEIFQEATKSFNRDVKIINNDPAFKGKDLTRDPRLRRQYDAAISQQFNTRLANVSIQRTVTNTGRAMIYQFDSNLGMMRATESQLVIHAEQDEEYPDFVAEMDELGHVLSLRPVKKSDMAQAEETVDDFLEHYGVVGMKWGRTRARGDAHDIKAARASVAGKEAKYNQQLRNAKSIRDKGQRAAALSAAAKVKAQNLNDPDRVLAARLTRGEKAASILILSPLGAGLLIGFTSGRSRRIERKQEKGKYDDES